MKRYKLLKDLPFAKAGETFGFHRGGINDCITLFKGDEEVYTIKVGENVSEMFDEWFEEVREYFYIDSTGDIEYSKNEWNKEVVEHHKLIGNYFETRNDIKESFEKHPKEWKTYLTYER